jgi:seryl-tRNA synthetase
MIDIKYLREQPDALRKNVKLRNASVDVDALFVLDERRLTLLRTLEEMRRERNEVAEAMKSATSEMRPALIERGKAIKEQIGTQEQDLETVEAEWNGLLARLPNMTHPSTPEGASDEDNKEIKQVGEVKTFSFQPKSHVELAEMHDLIDFTRAAKVSGAKFYFLKGKLALLEQALIKYGLDLISKEGYQVLITPDVAKEAVLIGKGFLPRGPEKQVYYVEEQDMALVGTSEITVLGYHMDEVIPEAEVPKKYVAFSHCFRTEAGAYGRESYGLYRVHQFSKVEMFAFCKPEQSEAIHLEFLRLEEMFWQSIGIPYRVVDCCTGDLGGSDYRRYDIEAWMWGKNEGKGGWGEVTSTSNCIDYQARGLQIKYLTKDGQREYVHTLNGTVVATPRALLSILENYQQEDGSILIPKVLIPYCGFDKIG